MKKLDVKIVILDAGTVDYGDLDLSPLKRFGSLKIYHHSLPHQIIARSQPAQILITNKCRFTPEVLNQLPRLEAIAVTATGYNNIDIPPAKARGIAVMNVPAYSTESVVQQTFAFILALAANLLQYNEAVHNGSWSRSPFFVFGNYPISEIAGKTLGIIGYGAIGKKMKQVARAFGMKVLVAKIPGRKYSKKEAAARLPLERVMRQADFVTIHAPLTELTRDLIDRPLLRKMKPAAHLINMARGGIVNEKDFAEALKKKWIAGGATDVLTQEPPPLTHPLIKVPHLLLTPHIAWASLEARKRLMREVELNIEAFLKGKRRNRLC